MAGRAQRLHHRPAAQAALAWLAASYLHLLHASSRIELRYPPATAALVRARTPFIGAFWHGRMLMMNGGWRALLRELGIERPLQTCVISSDHRDGRLMARATARLGVETVFGSTKPGRASLIKAARGALERGWAPLFTPDGPRGPRMRVKPGVIRLAMATGVPILPGSFAASNQRLLGSWDRFAVVLPGARCVVAFGPPQRIAPDGDAEEARLALERSLNDLTATADRALGLPTVRPADCPAD
jgi:lysophospholipid acyltransferase (LPLAT)-like uncharacterized protein